MALTEQDARHLLGRVGFAPDSDDVEHLIGRDRADVVDELLNLPHYLPARPEFLDGPREDWVKSALTLDWWLNRMVDSAWVASDPGTPHPLIEKMAMFWHGHFATEYIAVKDANLMWEQNQIFRAGALGDFEQLCQDVSLHGAMLVYLDNDTNMRGAEQENFARELMELFTMGIGNYTEYDVVEMARAWTGHGTVGWDPATETWDRTYRFDVNNHDSRPKTIFGIKANWNGPETITEICKGSKQQATAEFIATKLWRFFVDDDPQAAAIGDLAASFIASDMSIKALLRALLLRPEFWSPEAHQGLVKSPSQYVVDFYRCADMRFAKQDSTWFVRSMGQRLFAPPDVAGWGNNDYWLSTATMWGRARFAADRRWHATKDTGFLEELQGMDEIEGVDHLLRTFRIGAASAATTDALRTWFRTTKASDPWALAATGISVVALTPEFQVI